MKYDLNYFIKKFEKIPEEQWGTEVYDDDNGHKCAFGHCGAYSHRDQTKESIALRHIDMTYLDSLTLTEINDGAKGAEIYGSTPKERVVNYLKSLRDEKENKNT